jgi:uncharacterized membrane protein YjjP (DUF1212 family)
MTAVSRPALQRSLVRRLFRRGPWENAATAIIAAGVVMLCQPFWLTLYSYSFVTILFGTILFVVVTKFPR